MNLELNVGTINHPSGPTETGPFTVRLPVERRLTQILTLLQKRWTVSRTFLKLREWNQQPAVSDEPRKSSRRLLWWAGLWWAGLWWAGLWWAGPTPTILPSCAVETCFHRRRPTHTEEDLGRM